MTEPTTYDEHVALYSDLCDAAARVLYDIPDNDQLHHTGDGARVIANRVLDVLTRWDMYHFDYRTAVWRDLAAMPPEQLDRMIEYAESGRKDRHGAVDDDGYCELHSFKEIGQVSSDAGTFAIIDIGSGHALTDWFKQLVDRSNLMAVDSELRQFQLTASHELSLDGWKGMTEDGVVVNTEQGSFPVYARYCDHYDTGHMSICELRIDVHRHDLDDNEDEL